MTSSEMSKAERVALVSCATASLVLRCVAFFRYRFDSDESQHLHVAWGWTVGLVQYRDYFDNHAPLFHILTAPLLKLLGERSTILFYMRGAMLPLFIAVLAVTFVVADRLYSRRVAWWTVVLLSIFPPFFLKSLEYRTDNLWNTLWMLAVLLLITGPLSVRRWFLIGVLLGCALAVSMKTILLLVTIGGAGLITRFAQRDRTPFLAPAGMFLLGFAIITSLVAAYFASIGAWPNFVYCVLTFNEILEKIRPGITLERYVWPFAILVIVLLARRYRDVDPRRMFCAVAISLFAVTLAAFWLLISPRDMLPIMPLGAMFVASMFDRFRERVVISTVAVAIMIASLFYYTSRFADRTEQFVTMMNQVLRLTRPGEPIMDLKGETIFRPRPYYYIFELITRSAMDAGMLRDTVPESVIAANCHVAQADGPIWPERARAFLNENFVDLGRLRASGQWISEDGSFSIAVPGRYVVLSEKGEAPGQLDGSPYAGARELTAGPHRWIDNSTDRLAVLWAPAFERGFSPFHHQDMPRYRGRRLRLKRFP